MRAPLVAAFKPSVVEVLELPKPWPEALKSWGHLGVSENSGTPKSSTLTGFSIIHHPFWGYPYFLETPIWNMLTFVFLWLVVSTRLLDLLVKLGHFSRVKITNLWNHHLVLVINLSNLSWEICMELKDLFQRQNVDDWHTNVYYWWGNWCWMDPFCAGGKGICWSHGILLKGGFRRIRTIGKLMKIYCHAIITYQKLIAS